MHNKHVTVTVTELLQEVGTCVAWQGPRVLDGTI